MKVVSHSWKGDVHDGDIQDDHELRDARDEKDQPVRSMSLRRVHEDRVFRHFLSVMVACLAPSSEGCAGVARYRADWSPWLLNTSSLCETSVGSIPPTAKFSRASISPSTRAPRSASSARMDQGSLRCCESWPDWTTDSAERLASRPGSVWGTCPKSPNWIRRRMWSATSPMGSPNSATSSCALTRSARQWQIPKPTLTRS